MTTRAELHGRNRPRGRLWGGWFRRILIGVVALGFLGIVALLVAFKMTDIPKANDLALAQTSVIYYADGKHEMARVSEVNRQSVPLKKVPDHVQKALLAAEDRTFYENSGISPSGIARAVWVGLRGGEQQGGSTITQQYVKNYFLTQDRTLSRKAREIMISVKIDGQLSKDQILESYVNTIYFGRGAYGIQTAAKAYFNKDVSQLTPSEGALLATVINAPSLFDPDESPGNKQRAEDRWNYVMDGMVTKGWLTPEQRAAAKFPKTEDIKSKGTIGTNGYIVQEVKRELREKLKLTDADIDRGGLKVVTTIDYNQQAAAVKAVNDKMPTGKGTEHLRVGLTAIKPGDGAIVAMYGGPNYQKIQFNAATDARMQAGSTFKVFTLLAALQEGISTGTKFDGRSPQYFEEFKGKANPQGKVSNFSNEQFGKISLKTATAHSVNTIYAQLNIKVTPAKTTDAAVLAGLPEKGLDNNYANVFGTPSVRVIDMANAYATIAARGARVQPYLVRSVTSDQGYNYKHKVARKGVFDEDVTADATDAMTRVIKEGTGQYARGLGRPAAGKTGTTTDNLAAWFDGFTPQLATSVGIYNDRNGTPVSMDDIPGVGELTGGTVPVRIWTEFMKAALEGQPILDFPKRAGIGDDELPTETPTFTTTTATTTAPPTTTTTTKTHGKPTPSTTTTSEPTFPTLFPTTTKTHP